LTTSGRVGIVSNMASELVLRERFVIAENVFVEMVVWKVSAAVSGSHHDFKYRLALVKDGRCVVRYDNEAGKGDHKHLDDMEIPYVFRTVQILLDDFWKDVDHWGS
jgi:hypothetical protein